MRLAAISVLLLVVYCDARPSIPFNTRPSVGSGSSYIVGGVNATIGEFPWQLSMQRLGSSWSHSCGGSLLTSLYVLTAAHCVEGAPVDSIRVLAGVVDRTSSDGVIAYVATYKRHEQHRQRNVTNSDDIAILTLASPIHANGFSIKYAKLPESGDDLFVGREGIITGWGRAGPYSFVLETFLQKARIHVIDTAKCNTLVPTPGNNKARRVDDTHICLYDEDHKTSACNGDSGGPFNLDNGSEQAIVAGVTSWGSSCEARFAAVYARTSAYLDWIKTNTP